MFKVNTGNKCQTLAATLSSGTTITAGAALLASFARPVRKAYVYNKELSGGNLYIVINPTTGGGVARSYQDRGVKPCRII